MITETSVKETETTCILSFDRDGFTWAVGPFDTVGEAEAWAKNTNNNNPSDLWETIPLVSPRLPGTCVLLANGIAHGPFVTQQEVNDFVADSFKHHGIYIPYLSIPLFPPRMDKYDIAIEILKRKVAEAKEKERQTGKEEECPIFEAWNNPNDYPEGCLFKICSPADKETRMLSQCGCLTQVRSGNFVAYTRELTDMIRRDERIPRLGGSVTLEDLPVFAEWQRKLDAMFAQM